MLERKHTLSWHPSYWLAALGAGGLAVSFFMYLMWLVPHAGFPMPTWEHVQAVLNGTAQIPLAARVVVMLALVLMVALSLLHFVLLWWNQKQQRQARSTPAYADLLNSSAEVQLMSRPLTLAMTVNVCFALGAALVPGLWQVVEYLLPLAVLAFLLIGIFALRRFGRYLSRLLVAGGYKSAEQNHLSALIAIFAFAMLSVGFAAPAAMSGSLALVTLAASLSILFLVLSLVSGALILLSGLQAMMQHGLQTKASPSIWMLVPIMTLLGIEWLRIQHGLSHHFATPVVEGKLFVNLTAIFMLQICILLLGYRVMQLNGYLHTQLRVAALSPVSFGLICPGVAIVVMGMFWWHLVWVEGGIVQAFGAVYWLGIAVLAVIQFITLWLLLRFSKVLLR